MARVSQFGFELNSTGAGFETSSTSGSPTISNTVFHSGVYSGRISSLSNVTAKFFGYQYAGATSTGPRWTRFYYRVDTLPSAANTIFLLNNALATTSPIIWLTIDDTGALQLEDEDGTIGSPTTLSTTTWYCIEVKYDATGAAGAHIVEARLDGSVFATASDRSLSSGMHSILLGGNLQLEFQTTGDWFFDDVAHNSSSGSFQNSYPGLATTQTRLKPNAAGDNAEWDLGTGTSYLEVDEVTPDDGTTYIGTDDVTNDLFDANIEATPAGIGASDTVNVVAVGFRGSVSATLGSEPKIVVRVKASSGGTVEESAEVTLGNSTSYTTNNDGTSPMNYKLFLYDLPGASTTAWTKADLDTAQVGVRLSTADAEPNAARISTLWLEADTTAAVAGATTIFGYKTLLGVGQA